MGLLDGKVAIVTGAGAGLGRCHALLLAKEGAKVVVNDLGTDRHGQGQPTRTADNVVKEIKEAGGQAAADYNSVSTFEGAQGIMWTTQRKFGKVDVLVNNAGILRDKTLLNMSEADFSNVLDVHLKGTFYCLQAAARAMNTQGSGGSIINTSSVSGLIGNFGQGNYGSAKAGIYALTRVAHLEFYEFQKKVEKRINVNAVAPVAYTRMTEDLPVFEGTSDKFAPEKVSPVVSFLASDLAREVSGRIIGAEGGKFFEYKMTTNDGWTKEDGVPSTEDVAENLKKILSS